MKVLPRNEYIKKKRRKAVSIDMMIWKTTILLGSILEKELQETNNARRGGSSLFYGQDHLMIFQD